MKLYPVIKTRAASETAAARAVYSNFQDSEASCSAARFS
jgi:hypothetical protein